MPNDTTYISFYNYYGKINVFKSTIRSLGTPKFFRLRIREDGKSMLLEPYDRITLTSFRVPANVDSGRGSIMVSSKALTTILARRMGWNIKYSYRIPGKVYESQKFVVFDLAKAVVITEENSVNRFPHSCAEQQNGDNNG